METNNSSLDLLLLYKKCVSSLSFSFPDGVITVDEDRHSLISLLFEGKSIPMAYHDEMYISPMLLHDKSEDTYYPVGFFKAVYDKERMSIDDQLPVLNELFKDVMEEYSFHMKDSYSWNDVISWPKQLQEFIVNNSLVDKLELVPYFSFCGKRTLTCNSMYRFLDEYIHGKEIPLRYQSLSKKISDAETEGQIRENSFGFFAREQRVIERLSKYDGTKVSLQGKSVFNDFILKTIRSLREKKETMVFVVDKEDKELIESLLNEFRLSSFGKEIKVFSFNEMVKLLNQPEYENITPGDEILIRKHDEKIKAYFDSEKKRHETYQYPSEFRKQGFYAESLNNLNLGYETYPVNLDTYSEEDNVRDKKFFDLFDSSFATVKDSYVLNHPYYGLTLADTDENYQRLVSVQQNIVDSISDLMDLIQSLDWIKSYGVDVSCLKRIKDLVEDGNELSRYTGFPRKYFKINQEEEHKYDLNRLKKAFQALSSSTLLMTSITGKKEQDSALLKEILEDYHSKWFLKNRKGRKQLQKLMLHPNDDLETVVKIIDSYLKAKDYLDQILPVYVSIYGSSVSNMNGVVEIQSNISYIQTFYAREKENPSFTINNPLVKRCLRDKQFRVNVLNDISVLNKAYESIKQLLNEYIGCYRDIPTPDYSEILLCQMLEGFKAEQNHSHEEFKDYASFKAAVDDASLLLQLTLRKKYEAKEKTLTHFKEEFSLSMVKAYYEKNKALFEEDNEEYLSAKKDFLSCMSDEKECAAKEMCFTYQRQLEKNRKTDEYRNTLNEALASVKENQVQRKDYLALASLMAETYPISVCLTEDLYSIPDELFDNALILNSSRYSNIAVLSSYRVAKHVLFVSYEQESDKRIQGYHETVINKDSLYYKAFDFAQLGENFKSKVLNLIKNQYQLVKDDPVYPYVLKNDKKYAFLPDILISYPIDDESLVELAHYLAREENTILFRADSYQMLFDNLLQ